MTKTRAKLPASRGAFVTAWIEKHLVHSEGDHLGEPFQLTDEQKRFLWNVYELRPDGARRYRRVLRGRSKGTGKTELAAAVACLELGAAGQHGFPGSPIIVVAAASFEQADLLFGACRTMIVEGPLAGFFDVFDTEILRKDGPGRLYRVSASVGANDGQRPSLFIADEIHEWQGQRERVHVVVSNGLTKRADGWQLNITTAGSDLDTLAGRMYEHGQAVERGELEDPELLFDWQEAPADLDIEDSDQLRRAVEHCYADAPFARADDVLRRFHEVPRFEFERYYLNRWTAAPDSWLPPGAWDACVEDGAVIPEGSPVTLGVDVGTKVDTSAVVRLWKRDDGRVVVEADVFAPKGDGTALELAMVEAAIDRNARRFKVGGVAFDPWSFERSAQDLQDRGLRMVEFPQKAARMADVSRQLYDAIVEKRVVHAGDPVLTAHVQAGAVKQYESSWRLVKGKSRRPVDALIALAMGLAVADIPEVVPLVEFV
jgi:phage terminase large subunit-like protein